jgi:hypothetical protein
MCRTKIVTHLRCITYLSPWLEIGLLGLIKSYFSNVLKYFFIHKFSKYKAKLIFLNGIKWYDRFGDFFDRILENIFLNKFETPIVQILNILLYFRCFIL